MLVLQLGFFVTPVVYPRPTQFPYSILADWNPASLFLTAGRDLLVRGYVADVWPLVVVAALTFLAMLVGWVVYRVSMPIIIERMSA